MNVKIVSVLLCASLLAAACSSPASQATAETPVPVVEVDSTIIAEGRLEPLRHAEIAFMASGVISEVLVEAGQAVKKGETLIRLGDALDSNYAAAQLELANAQKALSDLKDTAGTDLAQAVIDLKEAGEQYDDAVDYLDYLQHADKIPQTQSRRVLVRTSRGYEYEVKTRNIKGPAPLDWITEAENDVALKKEELDAAQRAYDRMKDGVDVEQLAILEARLKAAEAGVAAFTVSAPFDGVVADLNARLGNSIQAGEIAVTVADFSEWLVKTTDLTEIDVVNLSEGDKVMITLDAIPDEQFSGTVLNIGQTYAENQGDVVYEVTILLSDGHPAMRWGMTAAVNFENQG